MDYELERVIARLEQRFDAAVTREEEEAASDLAVSLEHDRSFARLVRAGSALRLLEGDGATPPISVIGSDYCGTGEPIGCIRRLGTAALITEEGGPRPALRRDTFQEVLRRWARSRPRIDLRLASGDLQGRLGPVGPDNLMMEGPGGRVIVPLGLVLAIRLVPED